MLVVVEHREIEPRGKTVKTPLHLCFNLFGVLFFKETLPDRTIQKKTLEIQVADISSKSNSDEIPVIGVFNLFLRHFYDVEGNISIKLS